MKPIPPAPESEPVPAHEPPVDPMAAFMAGARGRYRHLDSALPGITGGQDVPEAELGGLSPSPGGTASGDTTVDQSRSLGRERD